jgi:serine-type D-Ala-D-Ala carboxypeptidase
MKLASGDPASVGMSAERIARLGPLLRRWVANGDQQCFSVVVARRGVVVFREACGMRAPQPGSPPVGMDTLFPLSSLSKPITATAAMILVEEGTLGLHFPVSYYIPELGGDGRDAVTPWHLMTHTSGLREADLDSFAEKKAGTLVDPEKGQHPAIAKDLAERWGAPLASRPGSEMSYCTYGYTLLGELVRRLSGMSLGDFARQRIFEPLGMRDTSFGLPESRDHRAVLRAPGDPSAHRNERKVREVPWPGAGAWSTADDMAVFGQMFLNRGAYGDARVLSLPTVAAMTRNQLPGISARYGEEVFPEASWSIGWSIVEQKRGGSYAEALSSSAMFCHGGAGGSFLWMDPARQLLVSLQSVTREPVPGARLGDCRGMLYTAVLAAIEEE